MYFVKNINGLKFQKLKTCFFLKSEMITIEMEKFSKQFNNEIKKYDYFSIRKDQKYFLRKKI